MKNRILMASLMAGISLCGLGSLAQTPAVEPESTAPRGPGGPRISFAAMDLNGDGSVSEAEFDQARANRSGRGPGMGRGGAGPQGGRAGLGPVREESSTDKAEAPRREARDEADAPAVESKGDGPVRERARARDGEDLQLRERRRDRGNEGLRTPQDRPRMERMEQAERRSEERPEFRRGPRHGMGPGYGMGPGEGRDAGEGRGPGRWERPMNREQGLARVPRDGRGERGGRGPGREGMRQDGMRRGPVGSDVACPHCGRSVGGRWGGEGRGPRG